MARVEFTYGGKLKHDYTGAHVVYVRNSVQYMGTVIGVYRDEDEVLTFQVRHFNGEAAPDVPAGSVRVLEREWESVTRGRE
jgi:hypothetical protein